MPMGLDYRSMVPELSRCSRCSILSQYRAIKSISKFTLEPPRKWPNAVFCTVWGIRLMLTSQPLGTSATRLTVRLTPLTVMEPL